MAGMRSGTVQQQSRRALGATLALALPKDLREEQGWLQVTQQMRKALRS